MGSVNMSDSDLIHVDVFLGGAPLLEVALCEGLMAFGDLHPQWRFHMRGADHRYSAANLKEQPLSGVLVSIDAKPVAAALKRAGIPWVHLLPGRPVKQVSVRVDDPGIGRQGAEYFLEKGFLRCAFCGLDTPWSRRRREGFCEALAEQDRPVTCMEVTSTAMGAWGLGAAQEKALSDWLVQLPAGTAVMAAHDLLANRLTDLAQRQGRRVPQDLAVLGVGNHAMFCRLSATPISSIDAAVPELAFRGAELLNHLFRRESVTSEFIAPKGIVERRSTEILAYGDDLVARIVGYIRERAGTGTTVEEILEQFAISRRTLSRRFAKYVGHSPSEEIRRARLTRARRLVTESDRPLTEIAMACGYSDLAHMIRSFQSAFHAPPGQLRG